MIRVYLALGSNLADPLHQVHSALHALAAIPDTTLVATSSLYRTPPTAHRISLIFSMLPWRWIPIWTPKPC